VRLRDGRAARAETPDFASITTSVSVRCGERREREQRRRRVAAGVRDEVGAGDLRAVELGQP